MKLSKNNKKYHTSNTFINPKKFFSDEEGSAMVEFALVLPLLIVLTIGSIYLSISFAQKSVMNGLTFSEIRAASVRQQHTGIAKHTVDNYLKRTEGNQKWLDETTSEIKADNKEKQLTIIVTKDALNIEILSNALNILGGRKPDGKTEIRKIKSAMVLPIEYITLAGRSDRPNTRTTVNYEASIAGADFLNRVLFANMPDSIKEMILPKSLVDPKTPEPGEIGMPINGNRRADLILGADPTYNMRRLNKLLDKKWGLDPISSSEAPTPFTFSDISKDTADHLRLLEISAERIALIKAGANLLQVVSKLSFGPAVGQALPAIANVVSQGADIVQRNGDKIAGQVEDNNNKMFNNNPIDLK